MRVSKGVEDVTEETYRATLSPASVTDSLSLSWVDLVESGVMDSLALVEKSLRPASDILNVFGGGWFGVGMKWCVW